MAENNIDIIEAYMKAFKDKTPETADKTIATMTRDFLTLENGAYRQKKRRVHRPGRCI